MAESGNRPTQRLTYPQAAELLGVHEGTVARMVRRGELTAPTKWAKRSLSRAEVEGQPTSSGVYPKHR